MAFSEIQRSGKIEENKISFPRNIFNLSRGRWFDADIGALIPFDVIECVPGDTVDINYTIALESKNPMKVPIRNNMRVFVKSYFSTITSLWAGGNNHISRGVRQDQDLETPKYLPYYEEAGSGNNEDNGFKMMMLVPNSPLNYMGVPWLGYNEKISTNENKYNTLSHKPSLWKTNGQTSTNYLENVKYKGERTTPISCHALNLVQYVKIKRKDYLNPNLTMNNEKWFPNEEDHFRLPYNCNKNNYDGNKETNNYVNVLDWEKPLRNWSEIGNPKYNENTTITSLNIVSNDPNATDGEKVPKLNCMYYVPRRGDYFWGSSPFADLIRTGNNLPSIDIESKINASKLIDDFSGTTTTDSLIGLSTSGKIIAGTSENIQPINKNVINGNLSTTEELKQLIAQDGVLNSTNINLMKLRNVIAETLVLERIGLISNNNFYNGYIQSIYGVNPNNTEAGDPVYIGGFYSDVLMDTVQNLNGDSQEMPLGFKAATAKAVTNGDVGRFTTNEFGYIMSVMYVVPDTIYNGGIEKMWTRLTQKERWNPLLQGTAPESINKKELGLPASLNGWNDIDKPFGYTKKDESYKWRYNKITGFAEYRGNDTKYALDRAYFIKTDMTTETANLNEANTEILPDNTKSLAWADQTDYKFRVAVACNLKIARNMVKEAKPSNMGMMGA